MSWRRGPSTQGTFLLFVEEPTYPMRQRKAKVCIGLGF